MGEKRRLPVLGNSGPAKGGADPDAADDEARPTWQWVGFGVVAMFAAWLPLAAAAGMISRRVAEQTIGAGLDEAATADKIAHLDSFAQRKLVVAYIAPHVVALGLAAGFAGYVIGKFGVGGARAASFSAAIVCLVVAALAVRDLRTLGSLVLVLALSVLAARGGAWVGAKRRKT